MRFQTLFEARWIFLVLLAVTLGGGLFTPWISLVGLILIVYTFAFFRDPMRIIPSDPGAVVAPADGVVAEVAEMEESEVVRSRMRRVAFFLSVFDVHVN